MSIKIKTQSEINLMRESGHILANVFKEVGKIVQAGISTKELDKFVYNYIRKNNAKPSFKGYGNPPFPASICASINNEVIHGIPSKKRILKDGDIIGLDIGVYYKGYHSDRAFTFKVGNVSEEASKLVDKTMESFFKRRSSFGQYFLRYSKNRRRCGLFSCARVSRTWSRFKFT